MYTFSAQQERNAALLNQTPHLGARITSHVLPFRLDLAQQELNPSQIAALNALEKEAASIALASLASLAKINELDHLGGGLELIPSLLVSLGITDYETRHFTIEHAHTSIGYYSALAALGFLERERVVDHFRRSLDIAGHVSWVPGGTELNGGRLGVMVPVAVGQALGLKARAGQEAFVVCHCGDAGWISGQALNGFNGADLHGAPITFVMHRNGIQLSGSTRSIMNKDPRPIIASLGIEVLEIPSLHDKNSLWQAYREAFRLAQGGRPSLIYPTGYQSGPEGKVTLHTFGEKYGVQKETAEFAAHHAVSMDKEVWIPGSLMSWRDLHPMLECVFLVNGLPGGEGHHDGHMKGRTLEDVLANPLFAAIPEEQSELNALRKAPPRQVITTARPAPGSPNLVLTSNAVKDIKLPEVGKKVSPRAGCEAGYELVAKTWPTAFFNVSCDLDPSTKLAKAASHIPACNNFQMSIEEQVSALMADGLACASREPQVIVFATFAAFFEGIAREGLELWRYHRNLNGRNEGLNVVMHLSHVGACTGRDHFSGWSLDWITLAMGYLPYLHRFYTPCDARAAFLAVKDLAAHHGGHIIGIPRDNLPVLADSKTGKALFNPEDEWAPVTAFRKTPGARRAILAMGAPAYLAGEAVNALAAEGLACDAYVINGLPFGENELEGLLRAYPDGVVTIEDGLIAHAGIGLRGFASLVSGVAAAHRVPVRHVGITDPTVAPSDGHEECWAHFGITAAALVAAVKDC